MATRVTLLLFLFLFITLSRARDLHNSLSESTKYHTVSFDLNSIHHLPVVTLPDLRPINRHVHVLRPFPLEFPLSHHHRRCRHGHRRQIPYGNDMILANDANTKDRRIPKRLPRIHGGEVMSFDRPHIHHHDHHEKSWFSKKIHELLNLF